MCKNVQVKQKGEGAYLQEDVSIYTILKSQMTHYRVGFSAFWVMDASFRRYGEIYKKKKHTSGLVLGGIPVLW